MRRGAGKLQVGERRRNIHNAPTVAEHLCRRLHRKVRPLRIQRKNGIELRLRRLHQLLWNEPARIVDQNIEAMELLYRLLHQALRVRHPAHVRLDDGSGPATGLNPCSHLPGFFLMHMVIHHHRRAVLRQAFGDGAADPAGRPGHNGHFALQQLHAHASIPVLPLAIGRLIHRSLSVGRWSRKDHV